MQRLVYLIGSLLIPWCLGLSACHGPTVRPQESEQSPTANPPSPSIPSPPSDRPTATILQKLTGTWDWLLRGTTQQGDLRIEQEEWHLQQSGSKLSGDYLRQVTTLSIDQKPYRCNGQLGYLLTSRFRVLGEMAGDRVRLTEISADHEQSPCSDERPPLKSYEGILQGDRLMLRWPGGEQQLIYRARSSPVTSLLPLEGGGRDVISEADRKLTGVWEWQLQSTAVTDGEGDLHSEVEEWHLVDMDGKLAGYFDRIVLRSRARGVFPCSGTPQVRTVTRYSLRGRRTGEHFFLNEVDYRSEPSPCENGGRRLDSYRGTVLPMGQLLLEWSGGSQILRRRRE